MSEAPNLYVITLRGDRGPMTRQTLVEQLRAGEVAAEDHVRNAFGRPLGTVAEVLGSEAPRQSAAARTSARRAAPRPHHPPPAPARSPLPVIIAVVVVLIAIVTAVALASGSSPPPVAQPPPPMQPKPAAAVATKPAGPVRSESPVKPGLQVDLFRLNFLPEDFPAMSPSAKPDWSGVVDEVSTAICEKQGFTENVYARWRGELDILKPGRYAFFLKSDDGSRLSIDDRIVVDNGGSHGMEERSATIELSAGRHPVRIDYFQGNGGYGLELHWQLDGFERTPLPSTVMVHAVGAESK